MPAAAMNRADDVTRVVLQVIPVKEDLETRVSLLRWPDHPTYGDFLEVADYIPSREMYARGYVFPAEHGSKVATGLRAAKGAQA